MLTTLISVVMPSYNASATISDSIHRILNQTYNNIELLIIDDCSSDNTLDIINNFLANDPRIKLFRTESNSGGAAIPRNIGINSAIGKYIAFCDADDLWAFNKLERQIQYSIQFTGDIIICSWFRVIASDGNPIGTLKPSQKLSLSSLLNSNSIGLSSSIISSRLAKTILFKEMGHEDYYFWLSCMSAGASAYCIQEFLVDYRISPGSLSSNKIRNLKYLFFVYSKFKKNYFWAFFRTFIYAINNFSKYYK